MMVRGVDWREWREARVSEGLDAMFIGANDCQLVI